MDGRLHSSKRAPAAQGALALLAGTLLTLLLQWAAGGLGPAGIFVNLSVPLPAAYVFMRSGLLAGAGIVAATSAVLFAGGDAGGCVGYLLQFGLPSLLLPLLLRRGWGWDRAVAGTLVVLVAAAALAIGGYAVSRGLPIGEMVGEYIQGEVDSALAVYRQADLPAEQLEELRVVLGQLADFLVKAWPSLAVVATGAVLLLMVLMLSALAAGRYVVPGPPFRLWKAPELLIWPLILAGFAVLFADGPLQLVALNLLTVLLPLYFLQGLAVVTYFFQKRGLSPFLRGLGYLLVAVLNPLPLIVTGVGVFDLWADFRKPRIKKNT